MVSTLMYEDTQMSGFALGDGKEEMKAVSRKWFPSVEDDESGENFSEDESCVTLRRFPAIPTVVSILPEGCCVDEDEKLGEDDEMGLVDEFMTCLDLMESAYFEDNRFGIERLMKLANYELVNAKTTGSVARALVCGNAQNRSSDRLRSIFLTYFCHTNSKYSADALLLCSDSEDSSTAGLGSYYSNNEDSFSCMGSLKLPATRILASSLELVWSQYKFEDLKIDLSSHFWTTILSSISHKMEVVNLHRVEASLSIKCIRLLRSMEPTVIDPFVRYSLMPFVVHAHEFGSSEGDLGLVRESNMLLDGLR